MTEIAEADLDAFVDMFYCDVTTKALHELGVPNWLVIAPGKTRLVRAILSAGASHPETTCAFGGCLMATIAIKCARCGADVEPGAFIRRYATSESDWPFCCETCHLELAEQDQARTKAYEAMVAERNCATAERRAQRVAERRASKVEALVNAGQLSLVKP